MENNTPKESRTVEITVRVCKETEAALKEGHDLIGLSYGELIDRMILGWEAPDPTIALDLILTSILTHCRRLTMDEYDQTLVMLVSIIEKTAQGEDSKHLLEMIHKIYKYIREKGIDVDQFRDDAHELWDSIDIGEPEQPEE